MLNIDLEVFGNDNSECCLGDTIAIILISLL